MPKKKRAPVETEETSSEKDDFEDDPEEHAEDEDEFVTKMRTGKKEEDVYTEEGREELVDDDEIEPWEEGYVEGVKGNETLLCRQCKKVIQDYPIERKLGHNICWFCSDECADKYERKKAKMQSEIKEKAVKLAGKVSPAKKKAKK